MEAYYQSSEKVRIIKEHELDYEIEDLSTGKTYLVDKTNFHRKYESLFEIDAYSHLKAHIHNLNMQLGQLRKANRNKDKEIRKLNKQLQQKRKKNTQHYKNGRRGTIKNGG